MTSEDRIRFEKLMGEHYRTQAQREERFAMAAWAVATDLINEILESELDGSGINDLRQFARTRVDELKEALDARAGFDVAAIKTGQSKDAAE